MWYRALLLSFCTVGAALGAGLAQATDSIDIRGFGRRAPAIDIDSLLQVSGTEPGFRALRESFYVAENDIPLDVAAGVYYGGAVQPDAMAKGDLGRGAEAIAGGLARLTPPQALERVQNFSDFTYQHPGCLECHYREHELWLAVGDTAQATSSYARFVTIARAIAFERTGESFAEAWPVTAVRDEYILLSLAGCEPDSRSLTHDAAGVPYDVYRVECAAQTEGAPAVSKTIYFDIRIHWATLAAGFGGVTTDMLRGTPAGKRRAREESKQKRKRKDRN